MKEFTNPNRNRAYGLRPGDYVSPKSADGNEWHKGKAFVVRLVPGDNNRVIIKSHDGIETDWVAEWCEIVIKVEEKQSSTKNKSEKPKPKSKPDNRKPYSITFYLRRNKHVYCRLTINTFSKDISTGISLYQNANWIGGRVYDPKNKNLSDNINDQIEEYKSKLEKIIEISGPKEPGQAFTLLNEGALLSGASNDHPKTILEACDYYIKSTNDLKKLSNHTIKLYNSCKENFASFLRAEYMLDDLFLGGMNSSLAKSYRGYLNNKNYAGATIHAYMTFIKGVVNVILEDFPPDEFPMIKLSFNPFKAKKISHAKKNTRITQYVAPSLMTNLWEYFEQQDQYSDLWNRSLLALYQWNSGYSFSDTCTKPDFITDLEKNKFLVYHRHKSGVMGKVLVYHDLERVLSIIELHEPYFNNEFNNWLPVKNFIHEQNKVDIKIHGNEYYKFNRFCRFSLTKLFGTIVTPHILRHSFAVSMLESGHSMVAVSKMMAHDSVSTTEKYYGHISNNRIISEKHFNTVHKAAN